MTTGITFGATPITGVYVRGRLATGVYVGNHAIWPHNLLGTFDLGVGSFQLAPRGLLAETGNSIRIAPRAFAFTGRPLQSAITQALAVDLQQGTTHFAGRATSVATGAEPALHSGAFALAPSALAVLSGHVIPAITGSLHFVGQPLPKVSGNEVAAYVSPGALQFASVNVAAHADAAAVLGRDTLTFTGAAQSFVSGSGIAVALTPSAVVLAGVAASVKTDVAASIGKEAVAFRGKALAPPGHAMVNVQPASLSLIGHYTDLDTSPFEFRSLGVSSAIGTSGQSATNVPLPYGARAGDTLLVVRPGPLRAADTTPANATLLVNEQRLALYSVTVTPNDATLGYVVFPTDQVHPFAVEGFRDADSSLDVLGAYTATSSPAATNATANVTGVTTVRPGSLPRIAIGAFNAKSAFPVLVAPWTSESLKAIASYMTALAGQPAVAPGPLASTTYQYATNSSTTASDAGAVMLAVRPALINSMTNMGAGMLDLAGVVATTAYSDPNVGLPINAGRLVMRKAQLANVSDTPRVVRVGQGVAYNHQAAVETQLPLPRQARAGDYMFLNVGTNNFTPTAVTAPRDSQTFVESGGNWGICASWIPLTQRDVDAGYIPVTAAFASSFTYVVWRHAARYLQAVGDVGVIDANGLVARGVEAPNASGAAVIAFNTSDLLVPSGSSHETFGAVGVSGWDGVFAPAARDSGFGGMRAGLLVHDPQIARNVPDVSVTYYPSDVGDLSAVRMFAIQPEASNVALALEAGALAFRGRPQDVAALATSGTVGVNIVATPLQITTKKLHEVTEDLADVALDMVRGTVSLFGPPLATAGEPPVPFIVQKVPDESPYGRTTMSPRFARPRPKNLLVVLISAVNSTYQTHVTPPEGWTVNLGPSDAVAVGPKLFTRVADGTETAATFTADNACNMSGVFYEICGTAAGGAAVEFRVVNDDNDVSVNGTMTLPISVSPQSPNTLALAVGAWPYRSAAAGPWQFNAAPGWTLQTASEQEAGLLVTATQAQDDSLAPITGWLQVEGAPDNPDIGAIMLLSLKSVVPVPMEVDAGAEALAITGAPLTTTIISPNDAYTDIECGTFAFSASAQAAVIGRAVSAGHGIYEIAGTALDVVTGGVVQSNGLDPDNTSPDITLTNSNETATRGTAPYAWRSGRGNVEHDTGKWYMEFHVDVLGTSPIVNFICCGLAPDTLKLDAEIGGTSNTGWGYDSEGWYMYPGVQAGTTGGHGTYAQGDVVQLAVDLDGEQLGQGTIWFGINGAWQGSPTTYTGGLTRADIIGNLLYPALSLNYHGDAITLRLKADEFAYSPPAGFEPWINGAVSVNMGADSLALNGSSLDTTLTVAAISDVTHGAMTFAGAALGLYVPSALSTDIGAGALSVTGRTLVEDVGAAGGTVDFVGACTPTYGAISSIALPAGCATGDTLLIVYHAGNSGTITPPSGSTTIIADGVYTSGRHVRVYGYPLTSADVTAGSVSLSVSSYAITAAVFRGVNVVSMVDVMGTFNVLSGNRPVIITANGITTATSGDMLIFCGAVASTGGALGTFTAPSDYGSVNNTNNSSYATILAYQPQATAGATGDVSAQFSNANFGTSGGVLIALKAG